MSNVADPTAVVCVYRKAEKRKELPRMTPREETNLAAQRRHLETLTTRTPSQDSSVLERLIRDLEAKQEMAHR
jgi:hypothetical protein